MREKFIFTFWWFVFAVFLCIVGGLGGIVGTGMIFFYLFYILPEFLGLA